MSNSAIHAFSQDNRSTYQVRRNTGLDRDFSMTRYDGYLNAFCAAHAHKLATVIANAKLAAEAEAIAQEEKALAAAKKATKAIKPIKVEKPAPRARLTAEEKRVRARALWKKYYDKKQASLRAEGLAKAVKPRMTDEERQANRRASKRQAWAERQARSKLIDPRTKSEKISDFASSRRRAADGYFSSDPLAQVSPVLTADEKRIRRNASNRKSAAKRKAAKQNTESGSN